ncbi:MAG: hypothetical protein AB1630_12590 [bacterium]
MAFLKGNQEIIPNILRDFNLKDFFRFYDGVINWLYQEGLKKTSLT